MIENHPHAGDAQKGKPQQHTGAKGFADLTGARMLHREQDKDDKERNDDDFPLTLTKEAVHHLNTAQALHRRGDRNGRGQHTVCQ